ncbi:Hypothetical predicted protein [Podarcis lilfordi]|uniref:Uncharacterized protein n=1 Tax=Podarcis lilfordi TaxID=74358 RepID=A0AA35K688_9SAUR|nr:Hypothetical predicted protein [Podarcis lilfordi]
MYLDVTCKELSSCLLGSARTPRREAFQRGLERCEPGLQTKRERTEPRRGQIQRKAAFLRGDKGPENLIRGQPMSVGRGGGELRRQARLYSAEKGFALPLPTTSPSHRKETPIRSAHRQPEPPFASVKSNVSQGSRSRIAEGAFAEGTEAANRQASFPPFLPRLLGELTLGSGRCALRWGGGGERRGALESERSQRAVDAGAPRDRKRRRGKSTPKKQPLRARRAFKDLLEAALLWRTSQKRLSAELGGEGNRVAAAFRLALAVWRDNGFTRHRPFFSELHVAPRWPLFQAALHPEAAGQSLGKARNQSPEPRRAGGPGPDQPRPVTQSFSPS